MGEYSEKMANTEELSKLIDELLGLLGFTTETSIKEEEEIISVDIVTPEAGLLIGKLGVNLDAFELILNLIAQKRLGLTKKIIVDTSSFRQKREEQLKEIARGAIEKVKSSQQPEIITGLSPRERRIIHLFVADDPSIETVSEGEEFDRKLVISPKKQS